MPSMRKLSPSCDKYYKNLFKENEIIVIKDSVCS